MKEVNELTRLLLAEGWKPEDTPPGTRPYSPWEGGWTCTGEVIERTVWETPCGLLVPGSRFLNGHMSYQGVDWRVENGNPVITCPVFPTGPCPLRNPLLWPEEYSLHAEDTICQCACHRTDCPYTYEGSVDEVHDRARKEGERRWEAFRASHKGRVCQLQSRYGRTSKTWKAFYDPMECAYRGCCTYCDVLAKELSPRKGNVFYDLRKTWTQEGMGLFPDQQRTVVEKGIKLLDKAVSLTICEAIVRYERHRVEAHVRMEHHSELFFNKTLKIDVIDLRADGVDTRDIAQDLQDIANGIEVVHATDKLKTAKAQKRARREAAKARRIRKAEKMLLTYGWEDLDTSWQIRVEKLLDTEQINELLQQRECSINASPTEEPQVSLFAQAGSF